MGSNKKSITLDLKSEEASAAFRRLAATADAIINNLRGDQPEKLGLDYKSLEPVNPAIVCLHISAYGRDNARKAWPGYDFLMQAEAGLMSADGRARRPAAALRLLHDRLHDRNDRHRRAARLPDARAQDRQGLRCRRSLFDVALHQLSYPGTWYLNGGDMPTRLAAQRAPVDHAGADRPHQGRLDLRHVHDARSSGRSWSQRIGRPDLVADPTVCDARQRGASTAPS